MTPKSEVLFIADLHLALEKNDITRRFLRFLAERAVSAGRLYILGDLFDAWVGDDDNTPPIKAVKNALKALAASGTAVFLQQGNRDFLLESAFCKETGVTLLGEYCVIDLQGAVLLTHGDLLCSDDLPYQAFRLKAHSPDWRRQVLSKPLWLRLLGARWYRLRSYWHKRNKSLEIMDVNQATVAAVMQKFNCRTLVHGHTHRPARHEFLLGGRPATRFVLADWKNSGAEVLCWNNGVWSSEKI
ncbi:MAG: UDP-2,3-diacylglucosamine diphosphatase [Methylomonas sp.]|jgi:UDP-2,3-diacylglucosamine hydrolase